MSTFWKLAFPLLLRLMMRFLDKEEVSKRMQESWMRFLLQVARDGLTIIKMRDDYGKQTKKLKQIRKRIDAQQKKNRLRAEEKNNQSSG